MRGLRAALAVATSVFACCAVADVDPIVIKGSKFFYKTNGTQFYIRGVAYQQDFTGSTTASNGNTYIDPLADAAGCKRDLPFLQELRTNTVRVYAIDPTADHSECMSMLADAGIYVVADLSAPVNGQSINRDSPTWDDTTYSRYTSVVDSLAKYTNVLGFFAGNEVSNAPNNTQASAFVKAAVRDMKKYISNQGYRTIGVGYATNDDADIRVELADYFNCGDPASAIDFWGYNIYSWCGDSSYTASGYNIRTQEFASYSVPAFFAEHGCNAVEPRTFGDVPVLYGPQMDDVWSGGIVYMYFQEANDFGLVSVTGNTVSKLPDFNFYSSQIQKATPTGVNMNAYTPTNSPAACPTEGEDWDAKATPLPPTPNDRLCSCMFESLSCAVSPHANQQQFGELFGTVCGLPGNACGGIAANGSTGVYGAYGMCNSTVQLSFAFNEYYKSQGNAASACSFNGAAAMKKSSNTASDCSALMAEAGKAGTGTVTTAPSATGGAGGSGSGASGSSAAGINTVPKMETGLIPAAVILTMACFSGMGMILL